MNREPRARNKTRVEKAYSQSNIGAILKLDRNTAAVARAVTQRSRKLNIEDINEKDIFLAFPLRLNLY